MTAEDNTRDNGPETAPKRRLKRKKRMVRLDGRRLAEAAAGLRKTQGETGGKRGTSRLRILIWGVQIAVAFAVLEHFVVRPFLGRGEEKPRTPTVKAVRIREPNFAPLLGEKALSMKGVHEAEKVGLANLVGLASGSLSMQQAQLTSSDDYSLPVEIVNSIGMRLRLVPPGLVILGSPGNEPGRGEVERQHVRVILHPFYLGKYEVTQAQYKQVTGLKPSHFSVDGSERPVEEVTWYDAQRFLKRLCRLEDVPIGTYRLPIETEWEYACRAGTTTAFHFGDDPARLGEYADTAENNYEGTVPVGLRLPNALGLYNMHGNVWEW
ncbi:MAG: formylglycine-generating enzyme family protein, partial [Lentisphaeria bacterium]|nr:formylglycine-generating enzyme family protein [Lentisphaeria bacterium]